MNECNEEKTLAEVANVNPTVYIITLNVNGLNTPVKRQTLSDWI